MRKVHQPTEGVPHRLRWERKAKPYGAYELKAKYQRGMLFGTLMTVLIALLFSSLIVYSTPVEQPLVPPGHLDSIIVTIGPRISIIRPEPIKDRSQLQKLKNKNGIPIPFPDDELIGEEISIATQLEKAIIVDNQGDYYQDSGNHVYVFQAFEDESGYPEQDEFVYFETPPKMIYAAQPVYPNLAKKAGLESKVWVKALVDKNGDVVEVIILISSESNAGFDEAAASAAKRCKFRPAVQNGFNVAVWVSFAVEFKLRE